MKKKDVLKAYQQSEKVHMLEMNIEHKRGHQNGKEVKMNSYVGKDGYNARLTHFEKVGDDLIGINYQYPKLLVLKGAAKNLESKCDDSSETSKKWNGAARPCYSALPSSLSLSLSLSIHTFDHISYDN